METFQSKVLNLVKFIEAALFWIIISFVESVRPCLLYVVEVSCVRAVVRIFMVPAFVEQSNVRHVSVPYPKLSSHLVVRLDIDISYVDSAKQCSV